ncbi:MAG: thiol-disulfide isomerase/thioredoxin [Aureispira sp.]|jgi:thiol-disulfide isomerase/thioredoxin
MMERYFFTSLLIIGLFVLPTVINAQGIDFETADWESVKAKAKASDMPIFVDAYASWCEPCKWMDDNAFSEAEVGTFFNDNYVSYKLDVEAEEGLALAKKYNVNSYPTMLYFNSDGELVHRIIGAYEAVDFLAKSKAALSPDNQIYTLKKKFEKEKGNPAFLRKYANALKRVGEEYMYIADTYIELIGIESLVEKEHFVVLEHCINDCHHMAYRYVLANKANFVISLGSERVDSYLDAAFNIRCYEIIENGSKQTTIRDFLQEVKEILPSRVDYFKTRIDFYNKRGDERKDYRLARKYEKHCNDAKSLNGIARYILNVYGKSKTHLNPALEWVNRAILLEESIETLETKALILLALEEQEAALEVAKKQLEISKKEGKYIKETEALIRRIKGE